MGNKLEWDKTGEHFYETGTDHVALYVAADTPTGGISGVGGTGTGPYLAGVAWNGCTGVTESPSGGEETKLWADNIKYLSLRSAEDIGATVTAYTYPPEWEECDGSILASMVTGESSSLDGVMAISQQGRKGFCLAFRTLVGNDAKGNDFGYKIHILYGCSTSPSEKANKTVNESPEANEFSWTIATSPIEPSLTIDGKVIKPTARVVIDASQVSRMSSGAAKTAALAKIQQIEDNLFGKDSTQGETDGIVAHILTPAEIYSILNASVVSG